MFSTQGTLDPILFDEDYTYDQQMLSEHQFDDLMLSNDDFTSDELWLANLYTPYSTSDSTLSPELCFANGGSLVPEIESPSPCSPPSPDTSPICTTPVTPYVPDSPLLSTLKPGSKGSASTSSTSKRKSIKGPEAHNLIEKRYRKSVTAAMGQLQAALPSHRDGKRRDGRSNQTKGVILSQAYDYIKDLERERDTLLTENEELGAFVKQDQLLLGKVAMQQVMWAV